MNTINSPGGAKLDIPGAKKLDAGKAPVFRGVLNLFPRAIYEVAKVSELGAVKYGVTVGARDYQYVPDGVGRYSDALVRHLLDEVIHGRDNTEKGGQLPPQGMTVRHAAQVAWDALARLEIALKIEAEGVVVTKTDASGMG